MRDVIEFLLVFIFLLSVAAGMNADRGHASDKLPAAVRSVCRPAP